MTGLQGVQTRAVGVTADEIRLGGEGGFGRREDAWTVGIVFGFGGYNGRGFWD